MVGGGVWSEEQKLLAWDGAAGDLFGQLVSTDGDILVASATLHDAAAINAGAAYVFTRQGGSWGALEKLVA